MGSRRIRDAVKRTLKESNQLTPREQAIIDAHSKFGHEKVRDCIEELKKWDKQNAA